MSLTKTKLKGDSKCRVTFTVPSNRADGVKHVFLAGEFNDWGVRDAKMKRNKNGSFSRSMVLPMGREYQYRYLLDGSRWINDEKADDYHHCDFANCDNSIVRV
jgi:1,4-alpha-glucan branching enzyme